MITLPALSIQITYGQTSLLHLEPVQATHSLDVPTLRLFLTSVNNDTKDATRIVPARWWSRGLHSRLRENAEAPAIAVVSQTVG